MKARLHCTVCHKRIGFLRSLRDKEYCSVAHRRMMESSFERASSDEEILEDEFEDAWHGLSVPIQTKSSGNSGSAFAAVGLSMMAIIVMQYVNQAAPRPANDTRDSGLWSKVGGAISKIPLPKPQLRIQEDFRADLHQWIGDSRTFANDWSVQKGVAKVGSLRLWETSKSLKDYRFEFEGAVEKRSMGWTFRSSDTSNYYATKLVAGARGHSGSGPTGYSGSGPTHSGSGPTTEIVRYVMLNGKETARTSLPVPMEVAENVFYHVQVKVKGSKFITSVGGQIIDVWEDKMLAKGGVGFFNDPGSRSSLKWVAVSDPDQLGEKIKGMLAMGFILPPGEASGLVALPSVVPTVIFVQ